MVVSSFANRGVGYHRMLACFLILVLILTFTPIIPIAPAYAAAPILDVSVYPQYAAPSQEVTITVTSDQALEGPPVIMIELPDESTQAIEATETAPNTWEAAYSIGDTPQLGLYRVFVGGSNLSSEEGFADAEFSVGDSTIRGSVYGLAGPMGGALPDCIVELFADEFDGADPVAVAISGGMFNEYEFPNVPPGTYWVKASPPESDTTLAASEKTEVTVGPSATVTQDLTLQSPSMTGTVRNPDGTPAANVIVEARTQDWSVCVEDETNENGYFALPPVPQGSYIVVAFAEPESGLANSAAQVFSLGSGTIDIDISPGPIYLRNATVTGRVLNPEGNAGIAGAEVMLHNENWSFQEEAETDDNGYYRFGTIPAGTYILEAYPGFEAGPGYSQSTPIEVTITGSPQTLSDINLSYPAVTGTVTNPNPPGGPATNAFVQVHNNNWSIFVGCPTDETGHYQIGGLPDGTYQIEAMPGQGSPFSKSVSQEITVIGGAPVQTIDLQLTRPMIVGWVYDAADNPVRNSFVSLHTADWQTQYFAPPIGDDGRFSFGAVEPGTYQLEINPPWEKPNLLRPEPLTVTVIDETTYTVDGGGYEWVNIGGTTGIKIAFAQASKTITGSVKRADDSPVTNAQVFAFKEQGNGFAWGMTDNSGNYSIGVSGGKWRLEVKPDYQEGGTFNWAYSGLPKKVSFANDTTPESKAVNFQVVSAGATVTGRICAPDEITPVTMAGVEVRNSSGQGNSGGTDMDGNFTINVPAGTYQVRVFLPPDSPYGPPQAQTITVSDTQTVDLGNIPVSLKDCQIKGIVTSSSGTGVANARVVAWQEKGGFAEGTTASDGTYSLNVSGGTWEVSLVPTPDASYVYSGPPKRVTVESGQIKTGVSFPVVFADATIQGRVVNGGSTMSDLYGFAVANNENGGYGGPLDAGRFEIKVPAGTYNVSGGLPPGTPYMLNAASNVVVASGQTRVVELTVSSNNKTISGVVENQAGVPINDPNLFVEIFAVNEQGAFQHTTAEWDVDHWAYTLNVSSGQWRIGYFVREGSGYIGRPPMGDSSVVTVNDGTPNATFDLALYAASAEITGRVTKPNGDGMPYAFVGAHQKREGDVSGRDAFFADTMTDANGYYTLNVPAGTYEIHTGLPPAKMAADSLIHPAMEETTVADGGSVTINMQFQQANASISGTAKVSGTGVPALIWAWSENGGYAEVEAAANGAYTLNVRGGTWHVGASYESDTGFFEAAEQSVEVSDATTLNLNLSAVSQTIPDAISVTFPANQMKIIDLSNGTRLQIPAGALGVEGNVTVAAKPTAGLRKQKDSVPVGLGYELSAINANGQTITKFNAAVTITFPYDPSSLPDGVTENDLVPAYWDEESGTWQKVDSAVVDTVNHTITVTTDHFSLWGNVAKKTVSGDTGDTVEDTPSGGGGGDTQAPAAPAGLAATGGTGKVELTWTANTEQDLAGYNLYRATEANVDKATKLATLTKEKTAFTDMTVVAGTTYHYWLSAFDATSNESVKAGPVSAEPTRRENPFTDIVDSHWAFNYILDLTERGIISGYADKTFRPAATVTRAEFAKMMCLAMGWELANPATPSFTDMAKDCWSYRYVETAKAHGVIGGYQDGTFRATKQITRAEIAKIVAGTLSLPAGTSALNDIESHWAKDSINSCVKAGIVGGYADSTFRPNSTATRAEAAKMVVGVLENSQ